MTEGTRTLSASNLSRFTPLMRACVIGDVEIVRFLLSAGEDATATDADAGNAIHLATATKNIDVLETLFRHLGELPNGESVRARLVNETIASGKISPLRLAAEVNSAELNACLIDNGARIDQADCNGITPLMVAVNEGHLSVVRLMLDRAAERSLAFLNEVLHATSPKYGANALHVACCGSSADVIKALLDAGASVASFDLNDCSAIDFAMTSDLRNEFVPLVIERIEALPADERRAFFVRSDQADTTSLHRACMNGSAMAASFLLANGADVNKKDGDGDTPLNLAVMSGNAAVVKIVHAAARAIAANPNV